MGDDKFEPVSEALSAPPFQIGQTVFVVSAGLYDAQHVKCPLCGGGSYVTVIVASTQKPIQVECDACSAHNDNRGFLLVRGPKVRVIEGTVTGVSMSAVHDGGWYTEVKCGYAVDSIHATREEAEAKAAKRLPELFVERDAIVEREMLHSAKKATWSAYYSRREIARAERVSEWHKTRLKDHKNLPEVESGDD